MFYKLLKFKILKYHVQSENSLSNMTSIYLEYISLVRDHLSFRNENLEIIFNIFKVLNINLYYFIIVSTSDRLI